MRKPGYDKATHIEKKAIAFGVSRRVEHKAVFNLKLMKVKIVQLLICEDEVSSVSPSSAS